MASSSTDLPREKHCFRNKSSQFWYHDPVGAVFGTAAGIPCQSDTTELNSFTCSLRNALDKPLCSLSTEKPAIAPPVFVFQKDKAQKVRRCCSWLALG